MVVEKPRWTKVEKINPIEPGHYVFAVDPLNRFLRYKALPNGERPTDNILGEGGMPRWGAGLLEDLLSKHPETVFIPQIPCSVKEFKKQMLQEAVLSFPWSPQLYCNGLVNSEDEYYWIYQGVYGNISDKKVDLTIEDAGVPQRFEHGWNMRSLSPDRNGVMDLRLHGHSDPEIDKRGPFWRGEVTLRAKGLGQRKLAQGIFLRESIGFINAKIVEDDIPTWKDNQFIG
jgi:hypothetical protein